MFTWLCRLMILVFAFNIVAPELAYAQQRPDIAPLYPATLPSDRITPEHYTPRGVKTLSPKEIADMSAAIDAAAEETRQNIMPLLHEQITNYKSLDVEPDFFDSQMHLASAIALIHALGNAGYVGLVTLEDEDAQLKPFLRNFSSKEFLDSLNDPNKLNHEDILTAMDPVVLRGGQESTDSAYTTFYAASIWLNDVNRLLTSNQKLTKEEEAGWRYLLPRIQLRALYRLKQLEQLAPNPSDNNQYASVILARGILRALIYQIHELYNKNEQDLAITFTRLAAVNPYYIEQLQEVRVVCNRETGELIHEDEELPDYCHLDADHTAERTHLQRRDRGYNGGVAPAYVLDEALYAQLHANDLVPRTIDASKLYEKHRKDIINEVNRFADSDPEKEEFAYELVAAQTAVLYLIYTNQIGGTNGLLFNLLTSLERQYKIEGAWLGIHGDNWSIGGEMRYKDENGDLLEDTFNHPKRVELLKIFFSSIEEGYANPYISPAAKQSLISFLSSVFQPRKGGSAFTRVMAADTIGKVSKNVLTNLYPRAGYAGNFSVDEISPERLEDNSPFKQEQRQRVAAYLADIYDSLSDKTNQLPMGLGAVAPGTAFMMHAAERHLFNDPAQKYKDYGMNMFQMSLFQDFLAESIARLSPLVEPVVIYSSSGPRALTKQAVYEMEMARWQNRQQPALNPPAPLATNPNFQPQNINIVPPVKPVIDKSDPRSMYVTELQMLHFDDKLAGRIKQLVENDTGFLENLDAWLRGRYSDRDVFTKDWASDGLLEALQKPFCVFKTNNQPVFVYSYNKVNYAKRKDEALEKSWHVIKECVAWIIGGFIFTGIFKAIRVGRMVVVGNVRVAQAGRAAQKAQKAFKASQKSKQIGTRTRGLFRRTKTPKAPAQNIGAGAVRTETRVAEATANAARTGTGTAVATTGETAVADAATATARTAKTVSNAAEAIPHYTPKQLSGISGYSVGTEAEVEITLRGVKQVQAHMVNGVREIREVFVLSDGTILSGSAFQTVEESAIRLSAKELQALNELGEGGGAILRTTKATEKAVGNIVYEGGRATRAADEATLKLLNNGGRPPRKLPSNVKPTKYHVQGPDGKTTEVMAENFDQYVHDIMLRYNMEPPTKSFGEILAEINRQEYQAFLGTNLDFANAVTGARMSASEFVAVDEMLAKAEPALKAVLEKSPKAMEALFKKPLSRAEFDALLASPTDDAALERVITMLRSDPDRFYQVYTGLTRYVWGEDMLKVVLNDPFKKTTFGINVNNIDRWAAVGNNGPLETIVKNVIEDAPNAVKTAYAFNRAGNFVLDYFAFTYITDALMSWPYRIRLENKAKREMEDVLRPYADDLQTDPQAQDQPAPKDIWDRLAAAEIRTPFDGLVVIFSAPILETRNLFGGLQLISDKERSKLDADVHQLRLRRTSDWRTAQLNTDTELEQLRTLYNGLRQQDTQHQYTQELDAIMREIDNVEQEFARLDKENTTLQQKLDAYNKWAQQPRRKLEQAQLAFFHKLWQDQHQAARQSYADLLTQPGGEVFKPQVDVVLRELDRLQEKLRTIINSNAPLTTQSEKQQAAFVREQTKLYHQLWNKELENTRAQYAQLLDMPANAPLTAEINAVLAELDKLSGELNKIIHSKADLATQLKQKEALFANPSLTQAQDILYVKGQSSQLEEYLAGERASWQGLVEQTGRTAEINNILQVLDNLETQYQQIMTQSSDPAQQREQLDALFNETAYAYADAINAWDEKQTAQDIRNRLALLDVEIVQAIGVQFDPSATATTKTQAEAYVNSLNQRRNALEQIGKCDRPTPVKKQLLALWEVSPALIGVDHPMVTTAEGQAVVTTFVQQMTLAMYNIQSSGEAAGLPLASQTQVAEETSLLFQQALRDLDTVWKNTKLSTQQKAADSEQIINKCADEALGIYNKYRRENKAKKLGKTSSQATGRSAGSTSAALLDNDEYDELFANNEADISTIPF